MTDRELLELAAKAAGQEVWTDIDGNTYAGNPERHWNPLTDDGDALRLAVKLGIEFHPPIQLDDSALCRHLETGIHIEVRNDGDPYDATRRAIVRAATEIGRSL